LENLIHAVSPQGHDGDERTLLSF